MSESQKLNKTEKKPHNMWAFELKKKSLEK